LLFFSADFAERTFKMLREQKQNVRICEIPTFLLLNAWKDSKWPPEAEKVLKNHHLSLTNGFLVIENSRKASATLFTAFSTICQKKVQQ
jgi:hypothetical protein